MARTLITIAGLAISASALAQSIPSSYSIHDLGDLGAPFAQAFSVNDAGATAGVAVRTDAHFRGALFSAPSPSTIEPLAGDAECWAFAINAAGAIAARSYQEGGVYAQGVLTLGGVATSLGNIAPRALNSGPTIVGSTTVDSPLIGPMLQPATWSAGSVSTLPTMGGSFGVAASINEGGWIVGWSSPANDFNYHATLWVNRAASDLGTLGGGMSQAYAISDTNQVVGWSRTAGNAIHAMLVTLNPAGGVASRSDLGTLDGSSSVAYAINGSGVVVGTSGDHAFVWTPASGMVDLNSRIAPGTGWTLEQARAINARGVIVGSGLYYGSPRAFILAPACYANCDGSTDTPALTAADFTCFLSRFRAGDAYANCDGSTGTPTLTAADFTCFLASFRAGCP